MTQKLMDLPLIWYVTKVSSTGCSGSYYFLSPNGKSGTTPIFIFWIEWPLQLLNYKIYVSVCRERERESYEPIDWTAGSETFWIGNHGPMLAALRGSGRAILVPKKKIRRTKRRENKLFFMLSFSLDFFLFDWGEVSEFCMHAVLACIYIVAGAQILVYGLMLIMT